MLAASRGRPDSEHGSVSIFALIFASGVFLFIGLVWDGGGLIDSHRSANEIAAEAGRTAAEYVDVNTYLATGVATCLNNAAMQAGVQQYLDLENAGSNGHEQIAPVGVPVCRPDGTVFVQVTVTRPVLFLSSLGFNTTATGQATVKLATGVTDSGG